MKRYRVFIETYQGKQESREVEAMAPHTAVFRAVQAFGNGDNWHDTRAAKFAEAVRRGSVTIIVSETP